MVAGEIIGMEKEADAAAGLIPNGGLLVCAIGLGEEEGGLGAGRRDADPAFGLAKFRVFEQGEAKTVDIEGNGGVIIWDDEGNAGNGLGHAASTSASLGS